MSKNPLDFCKKLEKKLKDRDKSKKIVLTTILFIIMGCFFYSEARILVFDDMETRQFSKNDIDLAQKMPQELNLKDSGDLNIAYLKEEELSPELLAKNNLEEEIREMTKNHPIEEMAPFIADYDKKIVALLVGIARKESSWGLHSPSKNGKTCYNYWGYKGQGSRGVALGYGCFDTPEEAVKAIGGRIEELVNKKIDTPQKMIVWKCGSSCAGHDPAGVRKWISDVSLYYNRINNIAS